MKYKLRNIDCAACAANIEKEISKIENSGEVNINPVTSVLITDVTDIEKIKSAVKKVDPEVEILEYQPKKNRKKPAVFNVKKEILQIIVVIFIFSAGILFKNNTDPGFIGSILLLIAYFISGWNVLKKAIINAFRGKFFDENFLMTIATGGAILINELPEAVAVMLFFNVGEFFQGLAVNKSRNSIKSLLEIRPDYANIILSNGSLKKVSPDDVDIGEKIIVKPGEKIPLDGRILEGNSFVDTFALTGEAVPRTIKPGREVLAGMINKSGLITIEVTKPFEESSISRILDLVQNAGQKKAETEKFITKFARFYTPVVVAVAAGIAFLPPLFFSAYSFEEWIYRALVILVISCPCALVVSIPLGYFGGIGGASRNGILIKGSNFLDALTEVKTVVFDKTGTLTKGVFKVVRMAAFNGFSNEEMLQLAAVAEFRSNHPIADSIKEAYGKPLENISLEKYEEISGQGVKVFTDGKVIIAGNDKILHTENIEHPECNIEGTVVHVAINKKYAGYIVISDELKDDAVEAINRLKRTGIKKIILLTGDNKPSAEIFAKELNIDSFYYELLPEDKLNHIENIIKKNKGEKIAFVGDGINDAPVITRTDVGIAMGGLGSDAAVEAADIVIMEDHPSKVAEAIKIAKKTRKIVWQNILFAIGIKAFFIVLGGFGVASMWEAVFADMGVALLAILNATRMLRN